MRLFICFLFFLSTPVVKGQSFDLNCRTDNLFSASSGIDGLLVNGINSKFFFTPKETIGISLGYCFYAKNEISSTKYTGNQFNFGLSFQKKWQMYERVFYFLRFNTSILYSDLNKEVSTTIIADNHAWGSEVGIMTGIQFQVFDEFNEFTGYSITIGSGLLRNDFIRNDFKVNNVTVDSSHSLYENSRYWNIPITLGFSKTLKGSK